MTKEIKQSPLPPRFTTLIALCPVGLGEEILSEPVGDGLFRIVQQPVEIPSLHFGDVVSVTSDSDSNDLRVDTVVRRSGYRGATIRLSQSTKNRDIRAMFERLGTCRTVDKNRFTIHAPDSMWASIARTIDLGDITIDPDWPAYAYFR